MVFVFSLVKQELKCFNSLATNDPFLVGVGRRWGKCLSSMVVYLDCPVVVRGNSVWFEGALHPVERYVFGR